MRGRVSAFGQIEEEVRNEVGEMLWLDGAFFAGLI